MFFSLHQYFAVASIFTACKCIDWWGVLEGNVQVVGGGRPFALSGPLLTKQYTLHLQCYGPHVYTLQVIIMHPEVCHYIPLTLCALNQPIRWCLTKPLLSLFMFHFPEIPFFAAPRMHVKSRYDAWTFHVNTTCISHWRFLVVSANQRASIKSAWLGASLNADWLMQSSWWPSWTNS